MDQDARYVDVALPVRVDSTFQYAVPDGTDLPPLGTVLRVPFGRKVMDGFCVGHENEPAVVTVRDLLSVNDTLDPLPPLLLDLARWIARYYMTPLGLVLGAMVPLDARSGRDRVRLRAVLAVNPAEARAAQSALASRAPARARILEILLSREDGSYPLSQLLSLAETSQSPVRTLVKDGLLSLVQESLEVDIVPDAPQCSSPPVVTLTEDQTAALAQVADIAAAGQGETLLLHGVTGSGKTEVYLRSIGAALKAGKQVITLVPEIALTPQMVGRYMARFDRVAVWHSGLTGARRREVWKAVRTGRVDILVGARSAIFAPFDRLGLIVVDEEHETSFKQQSEPRYHGRDVAVLRGRLEKVPVILGSATPALESYANAQDGKYRLQVLPSRIDTCTLPEVEVINLGTEKRRGTGGIMTERLRILTDRTLTRGEQAIFFLNRRGFSTLIQCPSCGFSYTCPRCEIPLTFHKGLNRAICHYCFHGLTPDDQCPSCLAARLQRSGIGTEQVEKALRDLFPAATLVRMDSDAVNTPDEYKAIFQAVINRDVDILIGTQMVAKGFDFPYVTLVGVVLADTSLAIPDFRSAERTFQLITQVAGRAGRSERGGCAVVQTFKPDHYSVEFARTHDYGAFADRELGIRKLLGYPPFGHLARLLFSGKDRSRVEGASKDMAESLTGRAAPGMRILGPAPPPAEVIRGRHRRHILLLGRKVSHLHDTLGPLRPRFWSGGAVRLSLDIDPIDMM